MVNEFAYCPRLFIYEWVEGRFVESVDTLLSRGDSAATGGFTEVSGVLAGRDLPDETWRTGTVAIEDPKQLAMFEMPQRKPPKREVRPMMTRAANCVNIFELARSEVGEVRAVLQIKDKEILLQEVRIGEIAKST